MEKAQIVIMLTALIGPFAVWGVKELFPFLPKMLLPAVATALGPLVDWLVALSTGGATQPVAIQLVAGAAAVAVRELVDQAKKAVAG